MDFLIFVGIVFGTIGFGLNYIFVTVMFFDSFFETKREFLLHLIPYMGLYTLLKENWDKTVAPIWRDLK